jgi:hypothetical protein
MSKDTDRFILEKLDDRDLLNAILSNKYFYSLTNEDFWKKRLMDRYPSTLEYKKEGETWKQYYLKVVYYIDLIQRKYNFTFTKGDPLFYYNYLNKHYNNASRRIKQYEALKSGHEDLAFHLVDHLKRAFGETLFKMGSKEWEEYKDKLIKQFEKN